MLLTVPGDSRGISGASASKGFQHRLHETPAGTKGRRQVDEDLVINPCVTGVLKEPTYPQRNLGIKWADSSPRLKEDSHVGAGKPETRKGLSGNTRRQSSAAAQLLPTTKAYSRNGLTYPAQRRLSRSSKTRLISGGGARQRVRNVSTMGSQLLQEVLQHPNGLYRRVTRAPTTSRARFLSSPWWPPRFRTPHAWAGVQSVLPLGRADSPAVA